MQKSSLKRIKENAILAAFLVFAIIAIIFLKNYIGFAGTEVSSSAGTVTEVVIDDRRATVWWHGLFGLAFSESGFDEEQSSILDAGTITSEIFVFNCIDPNQAEQEIYASTNANPSFAGVRAGSAKMIDDNLLNLSNSTRERANNTFTQTASVQLGSTTISSIPAVYTYVDDIPDVNSTFFTGILNASGELMLVGRLLQSSKKSFKDTNVKYQMLLPIPNSSIKWYFFADPNDVCPAGLTTGQAGQGTVAGFVFESNSTIPIVNATVTAGGKSNQTDESGYYNISITGNQQFNIISIKEGYITNISLVNVSIGGTRYKNLTMPIFLGYKGPNATLSGYVMDNSSGLALASATITVGGLITKSNATGNYSMKVPSGYNAIAAIKEGYENFVSNFSVSSGKNLSLIINMETALTVEVKDENVLKNIGYIEGFIIDNKTGIPLGNVTVTGGGRTYTTNSSGFYSLNITEDIHRIIAAKPGYNQYKRLFSIVPGYVIRNNITLIPLIEPAVNETVSKNVPANTPTPFNFSTDLGTSIVLNLGADLGNVGLNVLKYNSSNFGVAAPLMTNTEEYFDFTMNVSNSNINNATITLKYTANLSNPAPYYYNSELGVWEAQSGTADTGSKKVTFVTTHFSVFLLAEETGFLEGRVTDNETGIPLSDAIVTADGLAFTTNSSGLYSLRLPIGLRNLVAIKFNYFPYGGTVNISFNATTVHNITLQGVTTSLAINGTVNGTVTTSSGSGLEDVTVSISGSEGLTDESGHYSVIAPEGTHVIAGVLAGYISHIGTVAVTADQTVFHDFIMNTSAIPGAGEGLGVGSGAGQGAGLGSGEGPGQGPGTGVTSLVEQPVEIVEFDVSIKKIIKKIRQGNFITVPVTISNFKDDGVSVRFSIEGDAARLTRIDKDSMVLDGRSKEEVTLTILGNVEPGIYDGYFVVSGDINEKIPMYILVLEKERLAVEALVIKVTPEKKTVSAGSLFKYRVDLQNLLSDQKYKVDLTYSIEGITANRSIFIEKENLVILTSFSLIKRYELPPDLEPGDYRIKVHADFLELTSEHAAIFIVTEPFYKRAVFGVPIWVLMILVGVFGGGTFSVMAYKKQQSKKKRYQIEVDYGTLPKPGPRSAWAGFIAETKKKVFFDLDQFQIHTIVAGSTGGGKSVSAQVLTEEALMKGAAVVVFDPTAQWTGFLRKAVDKRMLTLYQQFNMKKSDARAFNGNIRQMENPREIIEIKKYMKPGEINVFVVNKFEPKDVEVFVANTIREVFASNLPEARQLKLVLIFDEFHRLLPKYGGTGQVLIQVERAAREFRKWGVALVLISQVISDFPPEVLANINTQIQMRTKDEGDLNRIKEEYGANLLQSLVKASIGTGMVENPSYNKGKPFFVAFRPLMHNTQRMTDEELASYNKYNSIVDEFEYQLDQLEKEGLDVFDLRLELKLAQDKVKAGSFNMVDIYLDGLKPRVAEMWKKIGKQPGKREVRYVSEGELEKELAKAKKELNRSKPAEGAEEEIPEQASQASGKEQGKQQEDEDISATIKRAREAKSADDEKNISEQKIQEKAAGTEKAAAGNPAAGSKGENAGIAATIKEIHSHIDSGDRKSLMDSYSRLQPLYKAAGVDEKKKILQECSLIRERLKK
ncbi:DUF853 family protein [Candidatus Woesearchaeota archaeon]|nr:DUF853 family protein [Candidatus Woesearchaeota archaeon]